MIGRCSSNRGRKREGEDDYGEAERRFGLLLFLLEILRKTTNDIGFRRKERKQVTLAIKQIRVGDILSTCDFQVTFSAFKVAKWKIMWSWCNRVRVSIRWGCSCTCRGHCFFWFSISAFFCRNCVERDLAAPIQATMIMPTMRWTQRQHQHYAVIRSFNDCHYRGSRRDKAWRPAAIRRRR